MRLKSYFAASVESAMAMARQEMGPDAMLMNSRKAPAEAKRFGEYEVVFAAPVAEPQNESPVAAAPAAAAEPAPWLQLSGEVSQLRHQVEQMAAGIGRAVSLAGALSATPELSQAMAALLESGVEVTLAHQILEGLRNRRARGTTDDIRLELACEIEPLLPANPTVGRSGRERAVVALVGPPGAGKTTTLAKLAIAQGLSRRRRTHFLSMDVERIGGAEQLRSYAVILGTGFEVVDTPCALPQMLAEMDSKDLVLIDTPGFGARDMDSAADLIAVLSTMPDIDCHLVIPASMRPVDVLRVCDRFAPFGIAKLLFTKVDETEGTGAILNATVRSGKPVSFLANGQQVPEDLEPASTRRLTELTLPPKLLSDTRQLPRISQRTTGAAA